LQGKKNYYMDANLTFGRLKIFGSLAHPFFRKKRQL
jgi:hypothetical protein